MMIPTPSKLGERIWNAKGKLARVPGAYQVYQWATKTLGEGRVYKIRWGPMKGFRWLRDNRLPYWYHLGLWEPQLSALLLTHLRPGDVFWDVGANAGYHALLASRLVGKTGAVVAFEPDTVTTEILNRQLELNEVSNCTVVSAAISDVDGTATLLVKDNNLQSGLAEVTDGGRPVEVSALTLDSASRTYAPPNVIKMDIEGGEVLAIPGGAELLSGASRPRMLVSVHGVNAKNVCLSFLEDHGYDVEVQDGFEQMLVAVPR